MDTEALLTGEKVDALVCEVLFHDEDLKGLEEGEAPKGAIMADGLVHKYGFHPERLAASRARVVQMLTELPGKFFTDEGSGWSFLNLPTRKDGSVWGNPTQAEALFCLAMASGLAGYCLEHRDLWQIFPGSVPYVYFVRTPPVV